MYRTRMCPYCLRAHKLLSTKGIEFEEINVDLQPDMRVEMERRSGRTSVPQIFIDDRHVGGFDDLAELEIDGELDELLGLT